MGSTLANDPRIEQYLENTRIVIASSALPANAAMETGGNLATIAGKDFATQTTLASVLSTQTSGTQKTKLVDGYGFGVEFTPMDEIRAITPIRLVGAQFSGSSIDANFWTSTVVNSATNTQSGAMVTMASGTNSAGSAVLQSARVARYVGGSSLRFRAVIRLGDTGTANNTRKWGAFDGETGGGGTNTDGAYFKLSGTTMSVCTLKDGTETAVASSSWNGDTAVPTVTNATTYEIYWTNSNVYFVISGVLKHTMTATSTTWCNKMSLPVRMSNINSGNTTDVSLNVRTATISRMGELTTQPKYYNITGNAATHTLKLGPGILHKIIFNNTTGTSIAIYDNVTAAAPLIGTITTALEALGNWEYFAPFNTGLVMVTTGNGLDATIIYE